MEKLLAMLADLKNQLRLQLIKSVESTFLVNGAFHVASFITVESSTIILTRRINKKEEKIIFTDKHFVGVKTEWGELGQVVILTYLYCGMIVEIEFNYVVIEEYMKRK